jgi:hypothetical protein
VTIHDLRDVLTRLAGEQENGYKPTFQARQTSQLISGLFPFLQQALEHDVPSHNAVGD